LLIWLKTERTDANWLVVQHIGRLRLGSRSCRFRLRHLLLKENSRNMLIVNMSTLL
jgi:hypothetical protein